MGLGSQRVMAYVPPQKPKMAGLAAPYNEEDTTHVMKVERLPNSESILKFWRENANQDLYTAKKIEMHQFHPTVGGTCGKATS